MTESSNNKLVSVLALAAALLIPGLLPQSAHGMYDPKHGRWLQRDPAGYVDGSNLHEYGKSSPVVFLDPNGTDVIGDCDCETIVKVAGIADYKMVPAGKLVRYYTRTPRYNLGYYDSPTGELMQIVMGMLLSRHTFQLIDGKPESWWAHVRAREKVVSRARRFPSIPLVLPTGGQLVNPLVWRQGWTIVPGVDPAIALLDPWNKPSEYAMGCKPQTDFVLALAWMDTVGLSSASEFLKWKSGLGFNYPLGEAVGAFITSRDEPQKRHDRIWIPGDKDYFKIDREHNTFKDTPGTEGIFQGWHVINVSADYPSKTFWFWAPGAGFQTAAGVEDMTNRHWTKPGEWVPQVKFPKTGLVAP